MVEVEYLTDELKHLIGWTATPERLPMMPTLREMVNLDEAPSLIAAGCVLSRFLHQQIISLPDCEFDGRQIEAATVQRALLLLLGFEGRKLNAPARRYRAITALRLRYTVDAWRRPNGPERTLMRLLASHIAKASNLQAVA